MIMLDDDFTYTIRGAFAHTYTVKHTLEKLIKCCKLTQTDIDRRNAATIRRMKPVPIRYYKRETIVKKATKDKQQLFVCIRRAVLERIS